MFKLEIDNICTFNASSQKIELIAKTGISLKANLSLVSLSYKKKVYQPGRIEIKLQLTPLNENVPIKLNDIIEAFESKRVDYYDDYTDKEEKGNIPCVCSNYYIFEIYPQNTNSSLQVILIAYSPDKYMTFNKYSKAYTGKKLIKNILINELRIFPFPKATKEITSFKIYDKKGWHSVDIVLKIMSVTVDDTIKNLQHIKYDFLDPKLKSKIEAECIFPYLIQYNESFYDFLVRITNRCGEFLFYENGCFYIGIPDNTEIEIITDNVHSISASKQIVPKGTPNTNYCSYNYCKPISSIGSKNEKYSSAVLCYNPEITDEDYATSFTDSGPLDKGTNDLTENKTNDSTEKKANDSWVFNYIKKENDYIGARDWVSTTWSSLNEPNAILIGTSLITNLLKLSIKADINVAKKNKTKKEQYLKLLSSDTDKTVIERKLSEHDEGNYQFSSSGRLTSGDFYNVIFSNEIKASNNAITIDMESKSAYALLLGNKISFDNKSYIISEAEGSVIFTNARFERSRKYKAIPSLGEGSNKNWYPPVAECPRVRQSTTQRAFVVDNDDPLRLNRVRIRYPWQIIADEKVDNASPWIRVSMPMASVDSGFNFIPEIDDEVLVNFENGNVEHPYVAGSLYYMDGHKPKDSNRGGGTRSISSRNGHRIIFTDPKDGGSFINSFFPLGGILGEFFDFGSLCNLKNEDQKKLAGGIELTDEYGLYSIRMSSSKRSISIDSPFGKVDINAFTGISINAPNGDIKIAGKNVTIEAGNNLTIKSGTNITQGRVFSKPVNKSTLKKTIVTDAADSLLELLNPKLIDLKLLRCVLEAIIHPIGGTMLIKSNRYMCLEAGNGSVTITPEKKMFSGNNINNAFSNIAGLKDKAAPVFKKSKYQNTLLNLPGFIDALHRANAASWDAMNSASSRYIDSIKNMLLLFPIPKDKTEAQNYYFKELDFIPNNPVPNLLDLPQPQNVQPQAQNVNGQQKSAINDYNTKYKEYKAAYENLKNLLKKNSTENIYKNTLNTYDKSTIEVLTDIRLEEEYFKISKGRKWQIPGNLLSRLPAAAPAAAAPAALAPLEKPDKRNLISFVLDRITFDVLGLLFDDNARLIEFHSDISDEKWKYICPIFVNALKAKLDIDENDNKSSMSNIMKNIALDKVSSNFIDQNVWSSTDNGDILISTKKDKTIHIKDKTIDDYVLNETPYWNEITNKLKDL
ncbi:MAG: phage baseplate assembly protein V [Bacteroides sp.]